MAKAPEKASRAYKSVMAPAFLATKLSAARIATASGADMIIANGDDFHVIHRLLQGKPIGTLFAGRYDENFYLADILEE